MKNNLTTYHQEGGRVKKSLKDIMWLMDDSFVSLVNHDVHINVCEYNNMICHIS